MAYPIQTQPTAEKPWVEWHSGLCDCFEDASTCCYGFWCCPCLACTVSNGLGENYCLPLCDVCSHATMALSLTPLLVPPAALSLRATIRNRYRIKGSLCRDIAVSCCCEWCSYCQMHREIKHRKKTPTIVNVQYNNMINMQVPVMMMPYQNQTGFMLPS